MKNYQLYLILFFISRVIYEINTLSEDLLGMTVWFLVQIILVLLVAYELIKSVKPYKYKLINILEKGKEHKTRKFKCEDCECVYETKNYRSHGSMMKDFLNCPNCNSSNIDINWELTD